MKRQCSSKCSMLTLLKLCSVPPDEFPISSLKKQFANMIHIYHVYLWVSLVAQMVKNLPAMWETQVRSLGREDPLERGM